ncbi:MAG TPA: hypothetical protein VEY11_11365 [Pyrinomonadaceae bacterium]|jgi:hypothetical protein|nr:hypothetical protein [Pyrinomonadaceae bacterium]
MQYTIVHDSDFHAFINTVNRHLEGGWEVQGGLAIRTSIPETTKQPEPYFYQAMIKQEEPLGIFAQGVTNR